MIAATVMVPCMTSAPDCRFDWTALSAVGGWIAALATFMAVMAALIPIVLNLWRRRQQVRLLGRVTVDDLLVQELHLLGAMRIPEGPNKVVSSWEYGQVSICVQMLNPSAARELLGFSDLLPGAVRVALADTIANLSAAQHRRSFLVSPQPGEVFNLAGDLGWYQDVFEKLQALRKELCEWLDMEVQDGTDGGQRLAEILRATAQQDEQAWFAARRAEANRAGI
jgi:hypothetical protein